MRRLNADMYISASVPNALHLIRLIIKHSLLYIQKGDKLAYRNVG